MAASVAALFRMAGAGWVLAREGAFTLVDPEELPSGPRMAARIARALARRGVTEEARSERLTAALNRLGPSYIKLGQFLATRPDLVGREGADALGRLRDEIDPFPEEAARAAVERALGRPVDELFSSFSPPVAAASIAQVHKAEVTDDLGTRTVAVKVLRPGIRQRFRRDLDTFYEGARLVERVDPASRRLRPVAVVDTLARSVTIEMDLRLEAAALSEMAEASADDPGFRVPVVEWDRTARDVLTLEWIDGIKLSDIAALRAAGHDLVVLARRLMQAFLRQALRDGFFHADMHQGNLFVDEAGDIVAVDYGIMGRLDRDQRRFLAEILFGFIRRDYRRIAEVHFEAGYVPGEHSVDDFAQALRAIGEPIHGQRASEISMARLLSLLFEVTEIFDMQTRPELLLVQKTMVVVEGVARTLDPDFDMWASAEPVVREWIERYLGPSGQLELAAEGAGAIGRLATELPRLAERAGRLSAEIDRMSEHGLRLDPETVAGIGRSEAHASRWGRVALWVIAVVAVLAGLKWLS
ncbi:MAG: 2-polyprenylphenol 6-hydroxylase [Bauldia sp.]|uniref:2-polyprenylphenol 6-hydroxylase n=1 Tax=Bauldia sp. TaxID=2575872 RepID=UPI001D3C5081|nr:2-polyprenylphenol 6-hydroxylase [Bauldia sp.]MCB1496466.1 2-polyprenylphenol 6-hydroxylase [Bauldia sp.]